MRIAFLLTGLFLIQTISGQKLISKNSHIEFTSSTPLEQIEANNNQAVSILDPATGSLAFTLLVKSFEFKTALMQEHFNENYLESDKFPKATFKGNITNNSKIDYKNDGTYPATVTGDLTIHNVTKQVTVPATIEIKKGIVSAKASFIVKPADYNISIPSVVENKIAREVKVIVESTYAAN
jgi:polyisoprenoid-binding protein YceI